MKWNQGMMLLSLKKNYSLENVLTVRNHAKTSVIVDCSCSECKEVLQISSEGKYFNKTYQWMIWDLKNTGLEELIGDLNNIGPNAQITYVNRTQLSQSIEIDIETYSFYDVHSKGRHLNAPLEVVHYADWRDGKLMAYQDVLKLQGIRHRDQFKQLKLRGATVIDQDNIVNDSQIISILSSSGKEDGVAAFTKYHYVLSTILQERFNFTLSFRNLRGWAGRLRGGIFRLGFLGVVMRNEADVGASGAFNRINRLAEFDTIHQSWKFDSAFMYRFTSDIDADGMSGNFLAPFAMQVWLMSAATVLLVMVLWYIVAWLVSKTFNEGERDRDGFLLKAFAAVCQQGLDPIPSGIPSRTIVFTLLLFSLVMYNFYTSSVVGGLLNSSEQGPKTVAEIVNSPLKLSFEDIGYYKVLFKNPTNALVMRMYKTKVLPERGSDELEVFSHIKEAIPFLKKGGYAFHCERVDAYPEIARHFDANEICDLRIVSGLLDKGLMNFIVTKNSMYTELFRVMMCRARETGIIMRTLTIHQPRRPECQSSYTVYPVAVSGVLSAFMLLGVGMLFALIVLIGEFLYYRFNERIKMQAQKYLENFCRNSF
uniref:Putative ionotropic receptor IR2 n=1 Tax=Scaeva pyrastri TaxID=219539 RepID=A0A1B3B7C1_SCAPY|nr:putative ionotropic receptor IR2 [Scaeva pyrastri]